MRSLLLSSFGLYAGLSLLVLFLIILAVVIGTMPVGIYNKALLSGTPISAMKLLSMKLRKLDVELIVNSYITAKKAGVKISVTDLETHLMAGGNIQRVVEALITAQGAKIKISVDTAKAIDLANRDILKAVQSCVNPVVITTPVITAVAKDGIELNIIVRVTVRTNLDTLIGGAGEETVIARVGEGVVTTVAHASTHSEVLENPDFISKTVFKKGLDKGTAYEIISLDIADVDVGKNIGARLQAESAEADMQIAHARAEEKRAMAVASEQEMKAKTQEMKAKLLDAESSVPIAISQALSDGNMTIMDYYRMQNMIADTEMRKSVANTEGSIEPIKMVKKTEISN